MDYEVRPNHFSGREWERDLYPYVVVSWFLGRGREWRCRVISYHETHEAAVDAKEGVK